MYIFSSLFQIPSFYNFTMCHENSISFECTIPLYVTGNINVTIGGRIFPVDIANNNFSIVVDRLTIFNFFFSPLRSMTMINVIIYLIHYSIHFLLKDQRY